MKKMTGIVGDSNQILIYWQITNWCNFNCTYCSPFLHDGSLVPKQPPFDELMAFCKSLNDLVVSGKKIELNISGGEPTVHPHFSEIIGAIDQRILLMVTTNGSRPTNWWKKLPKLPDSMIVSIHNESNLDRIIETSDYMISNNKQVMFNCSMDVNDWEGSCRRFETMRDRYGYRARRKVINSLDDLGSQKDPQATTTEQLAYLSTPDVSDDPYPDSTSAFKSLYDSKLSNDILLCFDDGSSETIRRPAANSIISRNGLNHFKGWLCWAGQQSMTITPTGAVMAGICSVKRIGSISDFKLAAQPLICPRTTCICPGDITISKVAMPDAETIPSVVFDHK
jgi:organic radical activating enzyme